MEKWKQAMKERGKRRRKHTIKEGWVEGIEWKQDGMRKGRKCRIKN